MTTNTHTTNFSKTIIATLTLLLLTGLSAAATISVDDDGSADNTTIGAAIDYASSGDTISVDSGNYGVVELNVSDLILKGPNSGMHGNSSERVSEAIFEISGDIVKNNVTVDGFEVATANFTEIKAKNTEISNSIVKVPDNGAPFRLQDEANGTKITKNKIAGGEGGNFVINARQTFSDLIHDVRITRNEFSDLPGTGKTVIQAAGFVNATINGNKFDNVGEDAIRLAGNVSGTEIKDNGFIDYAQDPGFPVGAIFANDASGDVTISNNQFTNAGGEKIYVSTYQRNNPSALDLDAVRSNNQYDDNSFVSGDVIVPDSAINVRNLDQMTGYDTIQAAVDDASSGDTIEVKQGTYNEQVVLDREKDGQSDLTIKAEDGASERPLVWYDANDATPTFAVDNDGITLEGLEIKRNDTNSNVGQAVRVAGEDTVLRDNSYTVDTSGDAAISVLTSSSGAAGNPEFNKDITSVDIDSGEVTAEGSSTSGVLIANTSGDNEVTENAVSVDNVKFADTEGSHFVELNSSVSTFDVQETLSDNSFTRAVAVDDASDLIELDFNVTSAIKTSVQGALDVADEGASVEAISGTYEEAVLISTPGVELTSFDTENPAEIRLVENSGTSTIGAYADDIEISDLIIERAGVSNNIAQGIRAVGDRVVVEDNIINKTSGSSNDEGVSVFDDRSALPSGGDGASSNVTVRQNHIEGFSVGINVFSSNGKNVDAIIHNNTITDAEDKPGFNGQGVTVARLSNAEDPTVDITSNQIGGNDIGVKVYGEESYGTIDFKPVDVSELTVEGNDLSDNSVAGIWNNVSSTLNAQHNYWGAASGPEGSGADVSSNVEFEPWLLEADGTEYEETVSLTGGDWSLVSAPESVDTSNVVVDDGSSNVKHFVYDTEASQFDSVDSVDSNPLSATFVYASDASGVGLNYSDSSSASKDVAKGWNVISSTQEIKLRDALSPVAGSLNSFFAPADYNDGKLGGTYKDLGERSSEVVDASSLDYLQSEFGSSQKVSRYDGYWVKASGSSTLELSVPQPE